MELYVTTSNIEIPTKVVAEHFEQLFKIKVTIVEYITTVANYYYTVYFETHLPTNYMTSFESCQYEFIKMINNKYYIRLLKPTNLEFCFSNHHHNMVTDEMYYQIMDKPITTYKCNGNKYELTNDTPFKN
jgi:hypothetical protein